MKEKILSILEAHQGVSVSGSAIGKELGLTRAAVWKNIKALQEDGYHIVAVTNKGYCLTDDNDIVSADRIRRYLTAATLGNHIECRKIVDSTNNCVKAAAQRQEPEGFVVIAEEQTAGRGRFGRHFYSPKEHGIYMSFLLRPKYDIESAALITAATSVCVAGAIEALTDCDVKIKWVNDLFVGEKKVCGILSEAAIEFESRKLDYVIVGIGVNISSEGLPAELKSIAGGISEVRKIERNRLIAEILNRLDRMLPHLSPGDFMGEYRKRSNVIGQKVTIIQGEHTESGIALDIDEQASLVVQTDSGEIRALNSGEISCKVEK